MTKPQRRAGELLKHRPHEEHHHKATTKKNSGTATSGVKPHEVKEGEVDEMS